MANSSLVSELKRIIKSEIVNDIDIVRAIGSPDYDEKDLEGSADDVLENYIFTWNKNPKTITETITFITLQVHLNKSSKNRTMMKPTLEIYIYSHNDHMKLNPTKFAGISANRNDYISQLIDSRFNGRTSLGTDENTEPLNLLGSFDLVYNTEGLCEGEFVYRHMVFETMDLNDSLCNI